EGAADTENVNMHEVLRAAALIEQGRDEEEQQEVETDFGQQPQSKMALQGVPVDMRRYGDAPAADDKKNEGCEQRRIGQLAVRAGLRHCSNEFGNLRCRPHQQYHDGGIGAVHGGQRLRNAVDVTAHVEKQPDINSQLQGDDQCNTSDMP